MAKRPRLSEQSFLAHLFSPKKNPSPTGIRKTHLSGVKGGRSKGRLAAFNRMSPVSQELLKRSGLREAYLRGEAKLSDAKTALRPAGIRLGVAKPVRPRIPRVVIRTDLDARVAQHLKYVIRAEGRHVNERTVDRNVVYIPDDERVDVLDWDYGKVKYAGRKGSDYEIFVDGAKRNPFWYH